jgi:hypothetical protein
MAFKKPISKDKLEKIKEDPMDDTEIKKYLGKDCKIITTAELNDYENIESVFPNNDNFLSFVILLFLDQPNSGHWCALLRYADVIEFYDSYGSSPSNVYRYCPMSIRIELGTEKNKLCELLDKTTDYNIIYNDVQYQSENGEQYDIATCGRHCCWRVLNLIMRGMILPEYDLYMKELKKHYKTLSYDDIVSKMIDIT